MMNANEIAQRILDLMAECNAEGIEGNTTDEDADPRLQEIGNLLTLFEVFHFDAYRDFVTANFILE